MIDLHTHTTASDGRCSPDELVSRAKANGVTVLAVTDHDTVAACDAVRAACARDGLEYVTGIEITAIVDEMDIHVLGYFFDVQSPALSGFLGAQRQQRLDRVRAVIDRLALLGMPLDADEILRAGRQDPSKAVGRPAIARALVAAGHVSSTREAFDRWLGRGCPGFIPRQGASPEDVFARIHEAGGLASLAHPGLIGRDAWIPAFATAGLDAVEAHHTEHDAAATAKYRSLAEKYGLLVSGGSDYHADEHHGAPAPGATSLPADAFDALKARHAARRARSS